MKRFVIVCAAALCGVALTCNESELVSPDVESDPSFAYGAKGGKPGGGGGDEPTPFGTIYATVYDTTYAMDGDGRNRVPLGRQVSGEPSHFLHGADSSLRWFLSSRVVGTGCNRYDPASGPYCYPDSTSMTELVLMGSNGTESALVLPDPLLAPGAARWAPADSRISFYGRRFPDAYSEAFEGGIYAADIDLTSLTLSNITLVAPTSVWSPINPKDPNPDCLANGICRRYPRLGRGGHDWSPSGERIAYSVCGNFEANDDSTYVVDVSSGHSNLLFPWGISPRWSSTDKLLLLDNQYHCWATGNTQLYAIAPDGSGAKLIDRTSSNRQGPTKIEINHSWRWSPTGEHLVYVHHAGCYGTAGPPCVYEIIRKNADGRDKKVLDTSGWDILGWR